MSNTKIHNMKGEFMKAYIIEDYMKGKRFAGFVGMNGYFVIERYIEKNSDIEDFMEAHNLSVCTIARRSKYFKVVNNDVSPKVKYK